MDGFSDKKTLPTLHRVPNDQLPIIEYEDCQSVLAKGESLAILAFILASAIYL